MALRFLFMAVALATAFGSGWTVRGWRCDAAASKVAAQAAKTEQAREAAASQALAKAEAKGREVVVRYVTRTRYVSDQSAKLKEDIRNAENQADAAGLPRARLSGEWVRLYNDALRPGGGNAATAAGTADAAAGAGSSQEGGTDEWRVLDVHQENADRWSRCRLQVNALIEYFGNSQNGVVTR